MRKRLLTSIVLFCGLQVAFGQSAQFFAPFCGSESRTDLDGGSASSTSSDPCLTIGPPSPPIAKSFFPLERLHNSRSILPGDRSPMAVGDFNWSTHLKQWLGDVPKPKVNSLILFQTKVLTPHADAGPLPSFAVTEIGWKVALPSSATDFLDICPSIATPISEKYPVLAEIYERSSI